MKMALSLAALCLLCFASAACGAGLKFNPQREGIFVFKMSPGQFRVIAYTGKVVDGGFVFSKFTPARVSTAPTDGYIVAKAKAGEVVAIGSVGSRFTCAGNTTAVFRIVAGQVAYAGDVQVTPTQESFSTAITQDATSAAQFMAQNYPDLAASLSNSPAEVMPVNRKCPAGGNTIYIHI